MGLYLCIIDDEENEIDGVEAGSYEDYCHFLDAVIQKLEDGRAGSKYPLITLHSDSDGEWKATECRKIADQFHEIGLQFKRHPAMQFKSEWQLKSAKLIGLRPSTLHDCFIDVDGENLIERIRDLCLTAHSRGYPILFQ